MPSYLEQQFGLRGKVALVTGSSRGLGRAMAGALAQAGADVVVNGRDAAALAAVVAELSALAPASRIHAIAADLSSRPDVERLIAEAIAWRGQFDILVNNAGIIRRTPAAEHSDADWDAVLSVNLDRSDLAFRTAFPIMVANSLGWFAGQTGELQESLATGSMTSVTLESPLLRPTANATVPTEGRLLVPQTSARGLMLISPSGTTSAVFTDAAQAASAIRSDVSGATDAGPVTSIIGPLNEVGIWTVSEQSSAADATESTAAKRLTEVAVNLASERETDLRPLQQLVDSPQTKITSAGWFSRPLWFYLIIVACVLTSLEWFLYQRRFIS